MRARCAQPKNHNELRAFTQVGIPSACKASWAVRGTVGLAFEAVCGGWTS